MLVIAVAVLSQGVGDIFLCSTHLLVLSGNWLLMIS